jgi:hypothetical protein
MLKKLTLAVCAALPLCIYAQQAFTDTLFTQEYHEGYLVSANDSANIVRSIAADDQSNIFIATAAGVFVKKKNSNIWVNVLPQSESGPAYAITKDSAGNIWIATWKSLFVYSGDQLRKIEGVEAPVSVLCTSAEGVYAIGPNGGWLIAGDAPQKLKYHLPRSTRDAVSDGNGGIWVASDVGLFHFNKDTTKKYRATDGLLSAAVKAVCFDREKNIWAAGLGGVNILANEKTARKITPSEGCPSIFVNAVRTAADGTMWVGTRNGVVRYYPDGSHSLLFSRRWLMDDEVNDITFDKDGTAWLATVHGVSAIRKKPMTLASKSDYFYDVLMRRHIREPWIAGQCKLPVPGDTTQWQPDDDDNDGEYTGNYLAMESFRYTVTKSEEAKRNAAKAFRFLKKLQDVTGSHGYFARTIVPINWKGELHDANRTYTATELAEELVKEPRFKPVEERWRKSADGQWLWKGDASSDEMCGHMMGYFFYYELAADKEEKKVIAKHVASIVDHLIANNFNMMDVDGTHTRWSVWSPDQLNRDPEWSPDQNQNSMELLAFLKLAYHVTKDKKYQQHYLHLIKEEHYLDNMSKIVHQDPAWFIYFDVILQAYLYPILLKCETDPQLLSFYQRHMDEWMQFRKADKNPLINFIYCYARNTQVELASSVELLKDTPLDLVSWVIDHRKREDIQIVHRPVLDEEQVSELPPASIRATIRWDANPWAALNGNPSIEREPVFWLFPYWMGRYLGMIK